MGVTLDVRDFGDALIRTGDLDPVYVAIYGAQLPEPQLCRLLLAYWCFYHLGSAAWLSEQEGNNFWHYMTLAARNDGPLDGEVAARTGLSRWPRAAERRHFRGEKCLAPIREWRQSYDYPESVIRFLGFTEIVSMDLDVMEVVQSWPMFGPWIAFKAADMMERVYGAKIQFDPNIGLMYEEPRAGLDLLVQTPDLLVLGDGTPRTAEAIYQRLLVYFSGKRAPPGHDRPCGPQEVETVLCKYKSHVAGRYPVGKDIREVRHALAGWGETANSLLAATPREVT